MADRLPRSVSLARKGGKVKALGTVALGLVAILVAAVPADASHPPDSDGYAPIVSVCDSQGLWAATHIPTEQANEDGPYTFSIIVLNECLMEEMGFGPEEVYETIRHEQAHAAGWDHCEGTPEENPGFWPYVNKKVGC